MPIRLPESIARRHQWFKLLPLVLLGVCVFTSRWASNALSDTSRRRSEEAYQMRTQEIVARITDELQGHEHLLLGGVGLIAATGFGNEDSWRRYTSAIQPHLTRSGSGGLGLATWKQTPAGTRVPIRAFAP